MSNTIIQALVRHLRKRKDSFIHTCEVQARTYDPTYGPRTTTRYIESVNFDVLLAEIDAFAETFRK